jgi:hypothetical protein
MLLSKLLLIKSTEKFYLFLALWKYGPVRLMPVRCATDRHTAIMQLQQTKRLDRGAGKLAASSIIDDK